MKLRNALAGAALAVGLSVAWTATSHAAIIVTPGNTGSIPDSNVISAGCTGNILGPATTIQGCLNDDRNILVNFTSDENLRFGAGGQARVEASDGAFDTLTISLTGPVSTFTSLILNIDTTEDGSVTFTGVPGGGSVPASFSLDRNGQNFFTITPEAGGDAFTSVTFTTSIGVRAIEIVSDVAQVRIGGPGLPVPEPGSLALLGAGLLGLAGAMRRRRHGAAAA